MIVRLRVARQTIHRIQDYSICFEEVYLLLQTFIATVRYTLQIVDWLLRGVPNGVRVVYAIQLILGGRGNNIHCLLRCMKKYSHGPHWTPFDPQPTENVQE